MKNAKHDISWFFYITSKNMQFQLFVLIVFFFIFMFLIVIIQHFIFFILGLPWEPGVSCKEPSVLICPTCTCQARKKYIHAYKPLELQSFFTVKKKKAQNNSLSVQILGKIVENLFTSNHPNTWSVANASSPANRTQWKTDRTQSCNQTAPHWVRVCHCTCLEFTKYSP